MKILKLYFTIIMLCMGKVVFPQVTPTFKGHEQFQLSFNKAIQYPSQLIHRVIPTITMMKVKFDETGTVDSILFSDSAFPQFVEEVNKKKNEIEFHYLLEDIPEASQQDMWILIPIRFDSFIGSKKSEVLTFDMDNLYLFSGKHLKGKFFLYPMIYSVRGQGFPTPIIRSTTENTLKVSKPGQ
ncbi:hypothetical protein [Sphingobacterium tabacisoli]|uniref:TonB C-terminal domain-containing protein n=1 Tax=Sphingobacterium tabacisoli TaxID=2044855 RepID=A0ABW5L3J4_9SPHI|nr:hypothetical protein [Sphingobacterium tabacisoli]